jgi:signal transduction histidine kinase
MPDYYHIPALFLTALLLPGFGYIYLRYRDIRTFLWFLGFLFAMASMVLLYPEHLPLSHCQYLWAVALGQTALQVSSALFLGSLSPLRFGLGRFRVLYVLPYSLPLVAYSLLFYGVFQGVAPGGSLHDLFPLLGGVSFVFAVAWSARKGSIPIPLSLAIIGTAGAICYWAYFTQGAARALTLIASGNLLVAALLIVFVFRRFSPGVLLSTLGFLAWSLLAVEDFPVLSAHPGVELELIHVVVMGKVVAAIGTILLALEGELDFNMAAREREQRARGELAAYSGLVLSRRRVEDVDAQGNDICAVVVAHSRFSKAALLLEKGGRYQLAGSAGMDAALAAVLAGVAARIPVVGILTPGAAEPAVDQSQAFWLDLTPWLRPGEDLKQMGLGPQLAVPLPGRSAIEGALLLSGMRSLHRNRAFDALRGDDLLPIEILAGRLQATRSQTRLLEKLIDAERFAGVGQLASKVTQQLNNPLTVILGYASLLEGAPALGAEDRQGVASILVEARRMRSTLETLSRVSHRHGAQHTAISVAELLTDMEQLHCSEFLQRSIEFRTYFAPDLPRVLCSAQQLRQAVLHCLQFCASALENGQPSGGQEPQKAIRLEARSEGNHVQILVAHSGQGFQHPERAFDPFEAALPGQDTAGLGLSLCATILQDNNGRASAINLEPQGAAILLELPIA